ncbi:MAG: MFS transporter [Opitutales bacterium]|nr:MFS transporter [Opitutales bacterium]
MSRKQSRLNAAMERWYERIADEQEGRVCKDISNEACREVPGNFFRILLANTLSKIGDQLSSPKSTLPWLLQVMQAPLFLTALLTPIRESGSLLPQIWIGGYVRQFAVRKWVWVVGSIGQALAIAGMGLTAWLLSGALGGWLIIALLVMFSLSRGFCSIAFKDVQGKTVPKTRRGLLNGLMGSASGAVAAAAGLVFVFNPDWDSPAIYGLLLAFAASLWMFAAASMGTVREFAGEIDGGGNGWMETRERVALLWKDAPFRDFVLVRSLALGSSLAAPFYVTQAQSALGSSIRFLGWFILAEGMAALISGTFWGKLADRCSERVITVASFIAAGMGFTVASIPLWNLSSTWLEILYPLAFFVLGIAHTGVRTGRKTYLVDMADGNKRTDYVAVSNSAIGVMLLLAGFIGALIATVSNQAVIIFMASLSAAAALMSLRLRT